VVQISHKWVVVQHTGPSAFLPNGEGMFRFSTVEEAAEALATINADYERHGRTAREIAEAYSDSEQVLGRILKQWEMPIPPPCRTQFSALIRPIPADHR
jgi:hypothetical protein